MRNQIQNNPEPTDEELLEGLDRIMRKEEEQRKK